MHIAWWRVDRYGRWTGVESGNVPSGLTLLFGPNEAGKTTWLHFVRAMLFGESRRDKSPYWSPDGGWGGRLGVRFPDGEEWVVERRAEGRREQAWILLPDGTRAAEEEWNRRLGGLSRFVYDQIFAFGLGELERFESLADPRIAGQLYSAGAGLRGVDLAAVEQAFQRRMENRYKNRGKNPVINRLLTDLQECDRQIRVLGDPGAEYAGLTAALAQCDEEEKELARRRGNVRQKRRELMRLKQIREIWENWADTEGVWRELSALPDVDPQEVYRLDRLAERVAELRLEDERVRAERANLEAERRVLGEAGPLWAERERVQLALQGQAREAARREERSRLQTESESLAAEEREVVGRLGPELVREGPGPDTSLGAREVGSRLWREVEEAEESWRNRRAAVEREIRVWERIREERRRTEAEVFGDALAKNPVDGHQDFGHANGSHGLSREDVERKRVQLRQLREVRQRRAEEEAREESLADAARLLENRLAESPVERFGWLGVVAVAAAMAAIGLAFGARPAVVWAVALVGAAAGLWWWRRWRRGMRSRAQAETVQWDRRRQEVEQRIRSRLEEERRLAVALFGKEEWEDREAEALEARLDEAARRTERMEEGRGRVEGLRREEEAALRSLRAEQRAEEEAAKKKKDARDAWESWLIGQGLPTAWSWSQVSVALDTFDRWRALQGQMADRRRKEEQLKELGRTWRRELVMLSERAGLQTPELPDDADPAAQAAWDVQVCHRLQAALENEARRAQRRERVEEELQKISVQCRQVAGRLAAAEEALRQGWSAVGAADGDHWRRLRPRLLQRREWQEKRRTLEEQMRRLAADEQEFDRVSRWDLAALEDALKDLDREEEEVDLRVRDLGARRSEHGAKLRELEEGRSLAYWLQRREEIAAQLRREAREWAVDALALHLLRRTKERYERDRQPAVMRRASTLFAALTGGRYHRIVVPLEEDIWYAEDSGGRRWPLHQLSRGTAEQMYLAVRLGLIDDLRKRGLAPPVVIDDVLVNFDPERRGRAAALLAELAREGQVFYLTCHPEVVADFRRVTPGVEVVDLTTWEGAVPASEDVRHG